MAERERLEKRIVKLEARLAAGELPELLKTLSGQKAEADRLKAENTNLRGEIDRLEQGIGSVKSIAAESLREAIAAGQMELHRREARIRSLEQEIARVKSLAAESARETMWAKEIEVDRLKRENASLRNEIAQLNQEIGKAKQSAMDSQHRAADAGSELERMRRIYDSRSATFRRLLALLRTKIRAPRHNSKT